MKTIYLTLILFLSSLVIVTYYAYRHQKNEISSLNKKIISLLNEIKRMKIKKKELRKIICNLLYNPHENNKKIIEKENWNRIKYAIDYAYDNFTIRLMLYCPELKEDEIHLCYLFKLGLNSSEISIRMNISNNAVRVRKSRLNKMLKATEISGDLNTFLDIF